MTNFGDQFQDAIAEQLRAERGVARLSVNALSEKSGLPRASMYRYLQGERDIPVAALYAMADALGVPVHELIIRAEARMGKEVTD